MPDSNEAYLKLITSEYATKPNFNSFVSMFISKVSPVNDIYNSFDSIFNIQTAVGDQLDKIGEILGVSRELPISDPDIPPVLSDDLYRQVLISRIYSNNWDGTIGGLYSIMQKVFPDVAWQLVDSQDMSMSIVIIYPNADPALIALLVDGYILPKPSGVNVNYTIQDSPLFGWDSDTSFIKGWDVGTWQ